MTPTARIGERGPGVRRPYRLALSAVAVTVVAGVLRLGWLGYDLPQHGDADRVIVAQAKYFDSTARGEPPPKAGLSVMYPFLLARLVASLPGDLTPRADLAAPAEEHLRTARHPDLVTRRVIATLSLLGVPLAFVFARRFLSPGWALVACSFVATSLTVVLYSRQARPHGALGTFCTLALIACMALARRGSRTDLLGAGVAVGLAVASLHNGAAMLPAAGVASVWFVARNRRRWWELVVPAAILVVAFLWSYPWVLTGKVLGVRNLGESVFTGAGFERVAKSLVGQEPVTTLAALVGCLAGLGALASRWGKLAPERRSDLTVVAGFAVPYLVVIGCYRLTWGRFLVPFLVCWACLAAYGLQRLASLVKSRPRGAAVVVACVPLCANLWIVGRLVWLQARPSTHELAAAWIEDNVERERETIGVPVLIDLPLIQERRALSTVPSFVDSPWQSYRRGWREFPGPEAEAWRVRVLYPKARHRQGFFAPDADQYEAFLSATAVDYVVSHSRTSPGAHRHGLHAALDRLGARRVHTIREYRALEFDWGFGGDERLREYEAAYMALRSDVWGVALDIYRIPKRARKERRDRRTSRGQRTQAVGETTESGQSPGRGQDERESPR